MFVYPTKLQAQLQQASADSERTPTADEIRDADCELRTTRGQRERCFAQAGLVSRLADTNLNL